MLSKVEERDEDTCWHSTTGMHGWHGGLRVPDEQYVNLIYLAGGCLVGGLCVLVSSGDDVERGFTSGSGRGRQVARWRFVEAEQRICVGRSR